MLLFISMGCTLSIDKSSSVTETTVVDSERDDEQNLETGDQTNEDDSGESSTTDSSDTANTDDSQERIPQQELAQFQGTITPLHPTITTSVQFNTQQAYGHYKEGSLMLVFAQDPNLSCERIVSYLSVNNENPNENPSDILPANSCFLFFKFTDYNPAQGLSSSNDLFLVASSSVSCVMGEAEWIWDSEYEGWRPEGENQYYWQGVPSEYDMEISGSPDEDLNIQLDIQSFTGRFSYRHFDMYDASSTVSGSGKVRSCPALENTGHW